MPVVSTSTAAKATVAVTPPMDLMTAMTVVAPSAVKYLSASSA